MILFVIVGTYWWIDLIQLQGFNWQNLVKVVRGGVAACKLDNFFEGFFVSFFVSFLETSNWENLDGVCLSVKEEESCQEKKRLIRARSY